MYSDALGTAGRLTSPGGRDYLRRRIAITCYRNNEQALAAQAIDEVIRSATEPHEGPAYWQPVVELARFASELNEAGDVVDAQRVLLSAEIIATRSMDTDIYADIALAAAEIGDRRMAPGTPRFLARRTSKAVRRRRVESRARSPRRPGRSTRWPRRLRTIKSARWHSS
jgi:hypothetical protein